MPEVRALPSTGVTRLRRYYDPVRLPPWPPPKSALRPLPSPRRVSPVTCSTFQRAMPNTPVDRSGGIYRLPPRCARPSPIQWRVGIHDFTFEACSGFTRVTARWIAQPPEAAFVTRLRSGQLPDRTACQLPELPTSLRMDSSSTGATRLRDAHWIPGSPLRAPRNERQVVRNTPCRSEARVSLA
jgi:hypothetical protein